MYLLLEHSSICIVVEERERDVFELPRPRGNEYIPAVGSMCDVRQCTGMAVDVTCVAARPFSYISFVRRNLYRKLVTKNSQDVTNRLITQD